MYCVVSKYEVTKHTQYAKYHNTILYTTKM